MTLRTGVRTEGQAGGGAGGGGGGFSPKLTERRTRGWRAKGSLVALVSRPPAKVHNISHAAPSRLPTCSGVPSMAAISAVSSSCSAVSCCCRSLHRGHGINNSAT